MALRLYEILVKTFYKRDTWEIDIKRLAEKIPMSEKYIAHIIPKVKAATTRIKSNTELDVSVQVVKQGRGQGKFIFQKGKLLALLPKTEKQGPRLKVPDKIFALIPEQHQPDCIAIANKIHEEAGEECLTGCIKYVLDAATRGEVSNFGAYMRSAYTEGYWEVFLAREKTLAQLEEARRIKEEAER